MEVVESTFAPFAFAELPHDMGALIAFYAADECLPPPSSVIMPLTTREAMVERVRARTKNAHTREGIVKTLRAAFQPLARLRSVSKALSAAPWLLDWTELFDFYRGSLRDMSSRRVWRICSDVAADQLLRECQDPVAKALGMKYVMQHGAFSDRLAMTYWTDPFPYNMFLPSIDPMFQRVEKWNSPWIRNVVYVQSARRLLSNGVTDDDEVGFPLVGVEHASSMTGAIRLHFLDELYVNEAAYGYPCIEDRHGKRINIDLAEVRTRDQRHSPIVASLIDIKRGTVRQWFEDMAEHHRKTHGLLTQIRAILKPRRAPKPKAEKPRKRKRAETGPADPDMTDEPSKRARTDPAATANVGPNFGRTYVVFNE